MVSEASHVDSEGSFPDFNYEYTGICDNKFLVTFTDYLTDNFEKVMTPQEFKTVLFCSNELIQNIGFYSDERDTSINAADNGIGKFFLESKAKEITMSSENSISSIQIDKLSDKLNTYNAMNLDELKVLYKQLLKTESPEDSKGGGIGFIEMIRKTKNPISFHTYKNDDKTFIIFQLTVRR